jgi:phosphatidylserine/phosphatidylglycerophosphate/cardiolipin synthase-like enzyme
MKKLQLLSFLIFFSTDLAHAHHHETLFYPGSLVILPQDGRSVYLDAFKAAQHEISIEICVLEDPIILTGIKQALDRGVRVRALVDNNKYESLPSEQINLAIYLTGAGGELHLSNPIFPRSFPKVILIDNLYALIGSACLDSTTFEQYRDYVYVSDDSSIIQYLSSLFENDWHYSAPVGQFFPSFNPTPLVTQPDLLISPVNSADRLVKFIQEACESLDITSELLGNATLQSEIAQAATRGLRVRLIAPEIVNGATPQEQALQISSLALLRAAGVQVHVTRPPQSATRPYMHARTAVADGNKAYMGSISLSPDSITFNREVGIILSDSNFVKKIQRQFDIDFNFLSF